MKKEYRWTVGDHFRKNGINYRISGFLFEKGDISGFEFETTEGEKRYYEMKIEEFRMKIKPSDHLFYKCPVPLYSKHPELGGKLHNP